MSENTAPLDSGDPEASLAEISAQRIGPLRGFMRRRPLLVDTAVVLLYLLLTGPSLAEAALASHWPTLGLLALTGASLFFRRSRPMFVLIVVVLFETVATLLDSSYFGGSAGLWIALYAASTKYAARRMFALTVLITALQGLVFVMLGLPSMFTDSPEDQAALAEIGGRTLTITLSLAFLLGTNAAAVAIGAAVRNNRLHEAELDNWAKRVQTLAQVRERTRIAREMHDVVAHSLSVMIALSDGAAVVLKRDPARAGEVLGELSGTGRRALADMRRVIGVLRTGDGVSLEPQPAGGSLEEMLAGFQVAGLPLRYTQSGPALPDDATFQLTVHRIIQESLTNVLRYGRNVSAVEVTVHRLRDDVTVRIHDDGTQQEARREMIGSAQGIRGMKERAALFDGTLHAGPASRGGWSVVARLKLPHQTPCSGDPATSQAKRPTPKSQHQGT
ncbi:sensor histidine kinase [Paeniglutamicibacter sulfureus]|uniref:histidine kinase n=1 Tax=Paeniglutamicibacter sulfureus TaxID=43666 RepID=A0ABU2BIN0_9MICC|nr:histidine kinase [Paeniglutamicibacter sulfureus]MDR7358507.1 signal transduction histidine kinase [Paeniglutamicibacter sulfureus]